ncbi:MAG: hypothetical protein Unbinned6004contig1002_9 [Prokaryotic dsDNA virus sp.]|nr:MAG: hypothetical protein Unbinned6004contig1002_9 [Prokaryotic dsDNA virus sp.]|tara:strand:- start:10745 stop:11347 length:603 start_codon:yes stop_codon:yes gene_type:complete
MAKTKITINVPTNWNDITIKKYQKFLQVSKNGDEIEMLSVLCNVPVKVIKKIKVKDRKMIVSKMNSFINKKPEQKLQNIIKFKEKEYGFIPNFSKLTTGEFVDLESYMKNSNESLHYIMSILYRPIVKRQGKFYNIESYNPNLETAEKFLDLPMTCVLSAFNFFFYLGENLLEVIANYSKKEMKKANNKELYNQNGVGTI